jgi:hypothetical protein
MTARWPLVLNGTTIQELQTGDTLSGVQAFAAGTAMLFVQTTAPTGWTKSTTHNDKALRVVNGAASSGGSVAFTTAFASQTPVGSIDTSGLSAGATTLSTTQIPSHNHYIRQASNAVGGPGVISTNVYQYTNNSYGNMDIVTSTGSGGSHTHTVSGSATFTGTAINLAVQYVDVIIATKD